MMESPTVWSWSHYRCRETERLQLLNFKTLRGKFSIPRDAIRRHFLWTSLGMLTAVMYLILRVRTWTSSSDNILAVSWSNIYILLWPPGVSCHGKVSPLMALIGGQSIRIHHHHQHKQTRLDMIGIFIGYKIS